MSLVGMYPVRCANDLCGGTPGGAKLFEVSSTGTGKIRAKCWRCGRMNVYDVASPFLEPALEEVW